MRLFFALALLALLQASITPVQAHEKAILDNVLNHYIQPSYARFHEASKQLNQSVSKLCNMPNNVHLSEAQKRFREVVEAWGAVEWFRVGSIASENRIERIFFFPDRKSRGLRQVQAALSKQDETVFELMKLQEKSVALQGLGALDFLLFGAGANTLISGNSFRCGFAKSVSQNLLSISDDVYRSWQSDDIKNIWRFPEKGNPLYRTEQEAMGLIIGTLIHGLEAIRDTRINVFLREEPKRDRPKSAPLWRSKETMASIAANLVGLEELFTQSQIEKILPEDTRYLGNTIRFEFDQSIDVASELNFSVSDLLADPEKRDKLEYLRLTINFIIARLNDELSPAIGITAGFSFGDGD